MVKSKFGPLINIWSMRFEAKHKESKTAATAISSRKIICYTLVLKSQLKMSHQFDQKTNFDFSNLSHVGKVLNITLVMKQNFSITLNNPDICKSQVVSWIILRVLNIQIKIIITCVLLLICLMKQILCQYMVY